MMQPIQSKKIDTMYVFCVHRGVNINLQLP
jgi:hypothetical protein